ncbi:MULTISPECIES: hypothetical protein [Thermomonospora]|uniref:Uncharacterized protein n=1 Tax=Thermomonospora curvata (strain ATCC 19995 / DSM 43183 / JCM 3096 / KCTC 9072 / NBRC 15933 / NCIMB 10081 / Henssen B9) TaxID=471852 RepID=D1A235_THECD|nr:MULTISPECIES: hypothetical protein [Thermomonospora]ACY99688.1 hypothetical protein Tcur_4161 [Thermomonospora curvata DSM 43183]
MPAFKKPFGFQPLEQQLAQRQAEQERQPVKHGKYIDHPTARYVLILLLTLVVVVHVGGAIVLALLGIH